MTVNVLDIWLPHHAIFDVRTEDNLEQEEPNPSDNPQVYTATLLYQGDAFALLTLSPHDTGEPTYLLWVDKVTVNDPEEAVVRWEACYYWEVTAEVLETLKTVLSGAGSDDAKVLYGLGLFTSEKPIVKVSDRPVADEEVFTHVAVGWMKPHGLENFHGFPLGAVNVDEVREGLLAEFDEGIVDPILNSFALPLYEALAPQDNVEQDDTENSSVPVIPLDLGAISKNGYAFVEWEFTHARDEEGKRLRGKEARDNPATLDFMFGENIEPLRIILTPEVLIKLKKGVDSVHFTYRDPRAPKKTWNDRRNSIVSWAKRHKVMATIGGIFIAGWALILLNSAIKMS